MTLVRGGEDRDLGAIAAMGHARAEPFRFHIDRDVDLIKHELTRKRLRAELGLAGVRQLESVIAEEGITAAAYIAISVVDNTRGWLPFGFLPPQVTIASASPTPPLLLARALSSRVQGLHLTAPQVLYWRSDLF